MLQLTANGFEITEVEDEAAAAAQVEAEEKASRAAARRATVRPRTHIQHNPLNFRFDGCFFVY